MKDKISVVVDRLICFAIKKQEHETWIHQGNSLVLLLRPFRIFQLPNTRKPVFPLALLTYYTAFCYSFFFYIKVSHKEEGQELRKKKTKHENKLYMKTTLCWCVHFDHKGLTSVFWKLKEQEDLTQSPGAREDFAQQKAFHSSHWTRC